MSPESREDDRFWVHGTGRWCFELDAEKQRPR
jgi:hypothetical protein